MALDRVGEAALFLWVPRDFLFSEAKEERVGEGRQ